MRIALAALLLALTGLGVGWWHVDERRALIAASVPSRPDVSTLPAELRTRIEFCERRIQSRTDAVSSLGELSRLLHANGFLAEARQCYEGLEQLDRGESRWPYRLAMILSGYGESSPAVDRLARVVKEAPDYLPARLRLGDSLLKQGATADAERVFTAVLARRPGEPYALLGLARCEIEQERWQAAREYLEQVVAATDYYLGYDLIVPVYERLGLPERAAAVRAQMKAWGAFRDLPDPWMEELLADCYDVNQLSLAAGAAKIRRDFASARRWLERAVQLAPADGALHFQLGLVHLDQSDFARAQEHLERCTTLAPDFADGWAYLSGLFAATGDAARAQRTLMTGLARCPDSYGLRSMRANQLKTAGRLAEAAEEYRAVIRIRPTDADAYVQLAMTLFALGREEESVAELRRALDAEPEHPLVLSSLAFQSIAAHDEPQARHWLQRARQQPRVKRQDLERLSAEYLRAFGRPPPTQE